MTAFLSLPVLSEPYPDASQILIVSADGTTSYRGPIASFARTTARYASPPVASWSSLVAWVRANDQAGADGAAITSVTPSAGTADAFTGTCTLKTGANGINSRKVFRGNGTTDTLVSTTGGASLTGDFYAAGLVRPSSVSPASLGILGWGDNTAGELRYLHIYAPDYIYAEYLGVNLEVGQHTVANTIYLVEMESRSGVVSVWVNGSLRKSGTLAASAYASTVLRLMSSPTIQYYFPGDMAEAVFVGRALTDAEKVAYRHYIADFYGLATMEMTAFGASDALTLAPIYYANGIISIGGLGSLNYSTTYGLEADQPSAITVWGPTVFYASNAVHAMRTNIKGNSVLSIRNESPVQSFSCIVFERNTGQEMAACGYCNGAQFPWGGPNGSWFFEGSNFFDTSLFGDIRVTQTKVSGNQFKLRTRYRDETQAIEDYDLTATEPSVSGPTPGLVALRGKPVTSVANNGTVNTNITTGATQAGIVILKDTTNGKAAAYLLVNATLTAIGTPDVEFTTILDNAATVNIYNSSGQLVIQNKTGGALNLTAAFYGA